MHTKLQGVIIASFTASVARGSASMGKKSSMLCQKAYCLEKELRVTDSNLTFTYSHQKACDIPRVDFYI